MPINESFPEDKWGRFYAKLGLRFSDREHLRACADEILRSGKISRIAPDVAMVEVDEIDATVMRMANSPYAEMTNRSGTVIEALKAGVFTRETGDIIESNAEKFHIFASDCPICDTSRLLQNAPASVPLFVQESRKSLARVENVEMEDSEKRVFFRELTLVSVVCKMIPASAFDLWAEIRSECEKSGIDSDAFTKAFKERPAFRSAIKALGKLYK